MRVLIHLIQQPFVAATGLAALVHSTWALGTLFAGQQPEGWALLAWLVPAVLIAFALDIGQIVTSAEIRSYGLSWARGVTFVVFAGATYYLQWLYIAHHMPALELAPGVRATWSEFATVMRDAAVWVIPALLPLSTLLYTFSGGRPKAASEAPTAALQADSEVFVTLPTGGSKTPESAESAVLTESVPFGLSALAAGESESTPITRPSRKRTVTENGRRPKSLRNKESVK